MRNRIRNINILVILLVSVFLIIPRDVLADTTCTYSYSRDSLSGAPAGTVNCNFGNSGTFSCIRKEDKKTMKILNLSSKNASSNIILKDWFAQNNKCPSYAVINTKGTEIVFADTYENGEQIQTSGSINGAVRLTTEQNATDTEEYNNAVCSNYSRILTDAVNHLQGQKDRYENLGCHNLTVITEEEADTTYYYNSEQISNCDSILDASVSYVNTAISNLNGFVYDDCLSADSAEYRDYLNKFTDYKNSAITAINNISSQFGNNQNSNGTNIQVGDVNCTSLLGSTPEDGSDNGSVAWLLNKFFLYFKICVPIIVLIFSTVDFVKAIILNNDDNTKKAYNKLIIRIIIAILLFLVPHLVQLLLTIFGIDANGICIVE